MWHAVNHKLNLKLWTAASQVVQFIKLLVWYKLSVSAIASTKIINYAISSFLITDTRPGLETHISLEHAAFTGMLILFPDSRRSSTCSGGTPGYGCFPPLNTSQQVTHLTLAITLFTLCGSSYDRLNMSYYS